MTNDKELSGINNDIDYFEAMKEVLRNSRHPVVILCKKCKIGCMAGHKYCHECGSKLVYKQR